jgi:L-ribulose-5-phosphate 4-epimerase
MAYEALKQRTLKLNLDLMKSGLVVLTWGNASVADRNAGVMAIKPSGVPYDAMCADDIVVLDITSGRVVEGSHRPSSDTPTHRHLYQSFAAIGGVVHTHSLHATSFAQALRDVPCFGTTHADNFYGTIPCTRPMRREEIDSDYELNTGRVIVEAFSDRRIDPMQVPGVLVASHAPFAWGETGEKALENAVVVEFAAQMAMHTLALRPDAQPIGRHLLDRHFLRKHGPGAYYGQTKA